MNFAIYEAILAVALLGVMIYWDYYNGKELEKEIMKCANVNEEIAKRILKLIDGC